MDAPVLAEQQWLTHIRSVPILRAVLKIDQEQWMKEAIVMYEALCFDVAQGRMNGALNETRTHSCWFASQAC